MFPKPLTPQKTNYRDSLGSLGLIQPKLRGSVAEDHMLGSSFSPPPSSPFRADANRFSESLSLSPCRTTDRYVPDRNNIDYDFCNHYLNQTPQDENADAATLTPGQRKLNREIKQLGMKKSGKRLIDCFESRRESIDESVESIIRKVNF